MTYLNIILSLIFVVMLLSLVANFTYGKAHEKEMKRKYQENTDYMNGMRNDNKTIIAYLDDIEDAVSTPKHGTKQ